ncbi:PilW family protein [Thiolapillus sp.]
MNFSYTKQRGISLISLMIASAIGIFLVGAVFKIYLDSKTTFNTRNTVAEVIENQRFALDDMRRILVMTGRQIRGVDDQVAGKRPFPAVETGGIEEGDENNSDIIAVRYRVGPSCGARQDVDVDTRPSMVRFLINSNNELVCELTTYDSSGTATTVPRVLASNTMLLKVLYGVDDDDDGYADRYLIASKVDDNAVVTTPDGANTPWARVVSIRFALVSRSDSTLPASARPQSAPELKVLGMTYGDTAGETDTDHLFRVASATVSLRNLNPTVQRQ